MLTKKEKEKVTSIALKHAFIYGGVVGAVSAISREFKDNFGKEKEYDCWCLVLEILNGECWNIRYAILQKTSFKMTLKQASKFLELSFGNKSKKYTANELISNLNNWDRDLLIKKLILTPEEFIINSEFHPHFYVLSKNNPEIKKNASSRLLLEVNGSDEEMESLKSAPLHSRKSLSKIKEGLIVKYFCKFDWNYILTEKNPTEKEEEIIEKILKKDEFLNEMVNASYNNPLFKNTAEGYTVRMKPKYQEMILKNKDFHEKLLNKPTGNINQCFASESLKFYLFMSEGPRILYELLDTDEDFKTYFKNSALDINRKDYFFNRPSFNDLSSVNKTLLLFLSKDEDTRKKVIEYFKNVQDSILKTSGWYHSTHSSLLYFETRISSDPNSTSPDSFFKFVSSLELNEEDSAMLKKSEEVLSETFKDLV